MGGNSEEENTPEQGLSPKKTIEEARLELKELIASEKEPNVIHIIKTRQGLGKTTTLCEYVKDKKNILIVTKEHSHIVNELMPRLTEFGVNPDRIKHIKGFNRVCPLFDRASKDSHLGKNQEKKEYLNLLKEMGASPSEICEFVCKKKCPDKGCSIYLEQFKKLGKSVVLTTNEMLNSKGLRKMWGNKICEIFVDEDVDKHKPVDIQISKKSIDDALDYEGRFESCIKQYNEEIKKKYIGEKEFEGLEWKKGQIDEEWFKENIEKLKAEFLKFNEKVQSCMVKDKPMEEITEKCSCKIKKGSPKNPINKLRVWHTENILERSRIENGRLYESDDELISVKIFGIFNKYDSITESDIKYRYSCSHIPPSVLWSKSDFAIHLSTLRKWGLENRNKDIVNCITYIYSIKNCIEYCTASIKKVTINEEFEIGNRNELLPCEFGRSLEKGARYSTITYYDHQLFNVFDKRDSEHIKNIKMVSATINEKKTEQLRFLYNNYIGRELLFSTDEKHVVVCEFSTIENLPTYDTTIYHIKRTGREGGWSKTSRGIGSPIDSKPGWKIDMNTLLLPLIRQKHSLGKKVGLISVSELFKSNGEEYTGLLLDHFEKEFTFDSTNATEWLKNNFLYYGGGGVDGSNLLENHDVLILYLTPNIPETDLINEHMRFYGNFPECAKWNETVGRTIIPRKYRRTRKLGVKTGGRELLGYKDKQLDFVFKYMVRDKIVSALNRLRNLDKDKVIYLFCLCPEEGLDDFKLKTLPIKDLRLELLADEDFVKWTNMEIDRLDGGEVPYSVIAKKYGMLESAVKSFLIMVGDKDPYNFVCEKDGVRRKRESWKRGKKIGQKHKDTIDKEKTLMNRIIKHLEDQKTKGDKWVERNVLISLFKKEYSDNLIKNVLGDMEKRKIIEGKKDDTFPFYVKYRKN